MKNNRMWILPLLLVIGIISLSYYAYNQIMTKTTFGETEIRNRVESLFNGEVQSIAKTTERYEVTFLKDDFLYKVSVDETEGTFRQITLLEEGTAKVEEPEEQSVEEETKTEKPTKEEYAGNELPKEETMDEPTKEPIKTEQPEALKPLTPKQASEIARSKFYGEVDEIEFVNTDDGGYYNVDIDNGEDEATLQIHALTGEVLTITYDD